MTHIVDAVAGSEALREARGKGVPPTSPDPVAKPPAVLHALPAGPVHVEPVRTPRKGDQ
jgi:hypothetical protein